MKEEFADNLFRVVDVLSPTRLVLNCGAQQGVAPGDRFIVYAQGKMLTDPITNEELEPIILRRGTGRVLYVQNKICTIESAETISNPFMMGLYSHELPKIVPFDEPLRGDIAAYTRPPKRA